MKEVFTVELQETINCTEDCRNGCSSENHYTVDWVENQLSSYNIELETDDEGRILNTPEEIKTRIEEKQEGLSEYYEVELSEDGFCGDLKNGNTIIGSILY